MTISKVINAICISITVCAVGYLIIMRANVQPTIDNSVKNQVIAEAKIIARKVDKRGIEHTIFEESNNLLPANLQKSEGLYDKGFVDSLVNNTDIQREQITSLQQIVQTVKGKNLQAVAEIDSLHNKIFTYNDSNFKVSYRPSKDSTKAGLFDYTYDQKLNIIGYSNKKWLFGEEHEYTDISTDDPHSTINGSRKITINRTTKDFAVKLTAKSIYMPVSGNMGTGASLRVRYKRWLVSGSQYYFPALRVWKPVVGVEFELLNY